MEPRGAVPGKWGGCSVGDAGGAKDKKLGGRSLAPLSPLWLEFLSKSRVDRVCSCLPAAPFQCSVKTGVGAVQVRSVSAHIPIRFEVLVESRGWQRGRVWPGGVMGSLGCWQLHALVAGQGRGGDAAQVMGNTAQGQGFVCRGPGGQLGGMRLALEA